MQNFRPFPPSVLRQMPGNLSGRTDGRTDMCMSQNGHGWSDGPMDPCTGEKRLFHNHHHRNQSTRRHAQTWGIWMAKQEQNRQRRRCSHSSQESPNQQCSPSRQPRGPRLRNHMGRNQIRTTKQFVGIYYGPQENTPIEETEREYSQLATQIHPWRSREEW